MSGPSKHLSFLELACKDGTPYPEAFILDGRVFQLAEVFESIRSIYNKKIKVLSAYRTPSHNKKIGGAPRSQHLNGRALDLQPPAGISVEQFYNIIRENAERLNIRGIGRYKTFIHIDIRPTKNLIVWSGTGLKDSKNA